MSPTVTGTLCSKCVELGDSFQKKYDGDSDEFENHHGLKHRALDRSAAAGCDSCRLLRQSLIYSRGTSKFFHDGDSGNFDRMVCKLSNKTPLNILRRTLELEYGENGIYGASAEGEIILPPGTSVEDIRRQRPNFGMWGDDGSDRVSTSEEEYSDDDESRTGDSSHETPHAGLGREDSTEDEVRSNVETDDDNPLSNYEQSGRSTSVEREENVGDQDEARKDRKTFGEAKKRFPSDYSRNIPPLEIKSFSTPEDVEKDLEALAPVVAAWLQRCTTSHVKCRNSSRETPDSALLPSRLIDVGQGDQDVRLHITAEHPVQTGQYLILSYCWGQTNNKTRTLASNIENRKRRIDISELSKTITDAIMVTRAFGERFLWVDAVCIIQGTIDWFDEAPKMGDYYKNAVCTIAATRAMDSSEGFLNPRLAQSLPVRECSFPAVFRPGYGQHSQKYKVQLVFQPQVPHRDDIIHSSPLYERGWTCQERLLSTRIMYWTEHALFWECLESEGSEFDHHGRVRQHRGQSLSVTALKNMKSYLRLPKKRALGSEWCKLVQSYSRLALTVEDDRLVALSGLANEIGKTFGDKCLYGHWRSRLRQSLRWSRSPGRRKGSCSEDTAVRPVPSWSWPSVRDAVDISDSDTSDDGSVFAWLMEVVDVSGELDHLKVTTEIGSTCKLHILGMVEPLRYDSWRETEYDTSTILFSSKEHPELGDIGIMFDDFSWDFPVSGTLLCLLVSRSICGPPYWERWSDNVPFIVVQKLSEPDTYKRIGYGGMSVSGENKRIRAFPSLLNTPILKRSLFLV